MSVSETVKHAAHRYVELSKELAEAQAALTKAASRVNDLRSTLEIIKEDLRCVGSNIPRRIIPITGGITVLIEHDAQRANPLVQTFGPDGDEIR